MKIWSKTCPDIESIKWKKLCLIESSITMLSLSQSAAIYFKIKSKQVAWSVESESSEASCSTKSLQFSFICMIKIAKAVQSEFKRCLGYPSEAILFMITKKIGFLRKITYILSYLLFRKIWHILTISKMQNHTSSCF